ncbi:MAG: CBS domain-containing protein [Bdellovibrionales bacterium]|nr:CBS domain-containing protein [Bdellovibrionales bacterium]
MKAIPNISKYMTELPHTIGSEQTLSKASTMMREYNVRHLPVLHGGKLMGILSDRDIKLVETFKDVDPEKVLVEEAYSPDPYVASPTSLLSEVCEQMASKKYGCALVVDNHKLVGIFTWIDALKALSSLLESRLRG